MALQHRLLRGQAGRARLRRLVTKLRRQGFDPTAHFVARFQTRVRDRGIRFDLRRFAAAFRRARHYRQTRPGYRGRIAVVAGIPVVYRVSGRGANRIQLITTLPALPPVERAAAPDLEIEREDALPPGWLGPVREVLTRYYAIPPELRPLLLRLVLMRLRTALPRRGALLGNVPSPRQILWAARPVTRRLGVHRHGGVRRGMSPVQVRAYARRRQGRGGRRRGLPRTWRR